MTVRLDMSDVVRAPTTVPERTPAWRGFLSSLFGVLSRIPGMKVPPNAQRQMQQHLDQIAHDIRVEAFLRAQHALRQLRSDTPHDTGATGAQWKLQTVTQGEVTSYQFVHPNPDRIALLNYGSKPHVIYPNRALALRFFIGGKERYAAYVFHPGTPAFGFLERTRDVLASDLQGLQRMVTA